MGKGLIILCLIWVQLDALAQEALNVSGPSLINTIDWASTNVVDVTDSQSRQYRQTLTYDLENNCQCQLKINVINQSGDVRKSHYNFHFGDINPKAIKFKTEDGFITLTLKTYNKDKRIKVIMGEIEDKTHVLSIYEKDKESASRLVRAFSHIARLCKK